MSRYEVGCAGQFVLGQTRGYDDLDEAFAACVAPAGCEVYDTKTKRWLGPGSIEEIWAAQARIDARSVSGVL